MQNLDSDSRVCWWLLLLFVLVSPFLPLTGIPITWNAVPLMDWQRIFEAATLLCCMAWALIAAPGYLGLRTKTAYAWASALILGLASALFAAQHLGFAILEWSWILMLVVLVGTLRLWGIANHHALNNQILIIVAASSILYLGWFWYLNAHIYLPFIPAPEYSEKLIRFPGFANVRYFSDFQSFMLLLLPAALERYTNKGVLRTVVTVLIAFYFALAFIVGSRSIVAAHVMLHGILLITLGIRYRSFLVTQLRFWLYGMVIFACLTWLPPLLFPGAGGHPGTSDLARLSASSREVLWQVAWDMIKDNPLLGVGPMHFSNTPNPIGSHPHNLILQFASEWGVPATLILIGLVSAHLWSSLKVLKDTAEENLSAMQLAMTGATLALVLQSMVAGTMNYPVSQILALLCFAYPLRRQPEAVLGGDGNFNTFWLPIGGWLSLTMVIATMTTLQSVRDRNNCFHYNPWPSQQYATRFWQQGWLVGPCSGGESLLSRSGIIKQQTLP